MYNAKRSSRTLQTTETERLTGKNLPASLTAEKALLGAILLNDENYSSVAELLSVEDFYSIQSKTIYKAIENVAKHYDRIDIVSVQDELLKNDMLEKAGGMVYLLELQEDIPAMGLVEQHAKIIKEKSVLRELINSAASIISSCYTQDKKSIDQILEHAEKTIFEIANRRTNQDFVQLNIWLKKTFQHLSSLKSNSKGVTGVPSNISKLDTMTSGFQNGDLIVLAARPSMGKTGLALGLGLTAALEGYSVGLFSLEMSAEQIALRLLSSESQVPLQAIRNATISSDEWIELTNVAARLSETKIFIDDTAMLNIMELRTKARKMKAEHGLSLLIIDYLQLLHSPNRHENRHQEVSEISRSLKALAKELEVPVIALSQLSRAVDSRMDKRPMLSDLRESGAIEQDADLIMFLYRDVVYNPEAEDPSLTELIIGKQRNGPTGRVYLNFIKEIVLFTEIEE